MLSRILNQPLFLSHIQPEEQMREIYNLSPWAPSTLKYITSLVILDIDNDPKDVGLPPFLGPDLQLKRHRSIKFKAGPSCIDVF